MINLFKNSMATICTLSFILQIKETTKTATFKI